MDHHNGNFPWISRAQLARESDREAREAEARKQLKPVSEIMSEVMRLKDRMAAECVKNKTDIRTVERFYEEAAEWAHEQQMAWRG